MASNPNRTLRARPCGVHSHGAPTSRNPFNVLFPSAPESGLLDRPLRVEAEDKLKAQLRAIKKQKPNAHGLNPKGVAHDGPLADLYMVYSQLSADAVHPTMTSLNRHTVRGDDPSERTIDVVPALQEPEVLATIDWACNAMLVVCVGVNQILGGTAAGRKLETVADRHRALEDETRQVRTGAGKPAA
ncbi:MAG: hypothetical protein ACHP84_02680 [Caulobacterales bacterium]